MTDEIKRKLQEFAEHAYTRIAELDKQAAEIKQQQAHIEVERHKAQLMIDRAANFPVTGVTDRLCKLCWVEDGVVSTMYPVDNEGDDIFRCGICQSEDPYPE